MTDDDVSTSGRRDEAFDTVSTDVCLELLRSKRRRTLLELLADSDDRARSLESLAAAVAQTEQPSELGAIPTERVCTSLHHAHLPKLDAAGLLDYDPENRTVEDIDNGTVERVLDGGL